MTQQEAMGNNSKQTAALRSVEAGGSWMRWVKRGHVRRVLFLVLCFLVFRKDLWRTLGRKRCLDNCRRCLWICGYMLLTAS